VKKSSNSKHYWGVDLGGTKIEGIILGPYPKNEVLIRKRVPTESPKGYQHILSQILKLVDMLKNESGLIPDKIGFGTPGTLEPSTHKMKNCNTTSLNGMPLKKDLEAALGLPISISNDANCFAIAETIMGIVPDHLEKPECVFGVILGTGVGGGLVVHGNILNGHHGIAGEWGHNFLDSSGGECYCGKIGCIEQVISGPALEKYYFSLTGKKEKLKDIVELSKMMDNEALKTLDRLHHFFGKAIANIINILDPDAIVLGGGVGNIKTLYTLGVGEATKHVFNPQIDTLFLKPKLGDSAGVFGAALL
jgi:predicted NBD/HSP70 family sugar kinase